VIRRPTGMAVGRWSRAAGLVLAAALACPAGDAPSPRTAALVAQAQAEVKALRLDLAHDLVLQALAADPGDRSARNLLDRIRTLRTGRGENAPDDERLRAAQAVATARRLRQRAAESDPRTARDLLGDAFLLLRTRDPEGLAAAEAAETAQALAVAEAAVANLDGRDGSAGRVRALDGAHADREREAGVGGRERDELLARIRDLVERDHLELALERTRTALARRPGDPEFEALWMDLLDRVHRQRRLDTEEAARERREELTRRIAMELMPTSIDSLPTYAADWERRRELRDARLIRGSEQADWELDLEARLAERVTFDVTEADAIDLLQSLTRGRVPIAIDPAVSSAPPRLVTLKAHSMRLDHAIAWICRALGVPWSLAQGAVYVGRDDLEPVVVAVHDAGILGLQLQDAPVMSFNMSLGDEQAAGGNLFNAQPEEGASGLMSAQEVLDLLQRSVAPAYWTSPGAAPPELRGNLLIVVAPPRVQRLVAEFIRSQSELSSLVVQCDLRLLEISDQLIEQIGIDWTAGQLLQQAATGLYRLGDNTEIAGRTNSPLPDLGLVNAGSISSASANNSGLTLQVTNLADVQMSAVLRATEVGAQAREVNAASVATFNGLRASAAFITQIAVISDYTVVDGALDPVVSVINSGTAISAKPRVSADRRFVIAEVQPAVGRVSFFRESIRALGLINQGEDEDGEVVVIPQALDYPIELPRLNIVQAGTTVRVPDRGSILVGGLTRSLDQTAESRIPWLSDIPFLGRVFGTRGRLSDRSRLYLFAKFTIIDYPELESKL
jgi:hypothetical protein